MTNDSPEKLVVYKYTSLTCFESYIKVVEEKEIVNDLSAETVKSAALAFECVNNIHGSDSLSASVLSVSDCITDNVLKEDFEHSTSLLID